MGESTGEPQPPTDPEIDVVAGRGRQLSVGPEFEGLRVLGHVARNYIVNLYQVAELDEDEVLLVQSWRTSSRNAWGLCSACPTSESRTSLGRLGAARAAFLRFA
jgi:hypothetical protein